MEQKRALNKSYPIWIATILLCVFGVIMVYSASAYVCSISKKFENDPLYLFERQLAFFALGAVACFIFQFFNYHILYKLSPFIYVAGLVCIVLLLTGMTTDSHGATRWLDLGFVSIQVAEIVKISVIVFGASMIYHCSKILKPWALALLIWLGGGGAAVMLLLISNDLSSSIVVLGITFGITFVFTKTPKMHWVVIAVAVIFIGVYVYYMSQNLPTPEELKEMDFRTQRICGWLDPEKYAEDASYQTVQGLYAIGSGGILGKGLGNSVQKLTKIPEGFNDMIFSILCEELGVVGGTVLIVLFLYLLYYIYKVATSSKDLLGNVLAFGVFAHIGIQGIMNIAVNLAVFPNTGIGLPFMSYGGSALVCQLFEIAIVLSVERRTRLKDYYKMKRQMRAEKKRNKAELGSVKRAAVSS